MVQTVLSPSLKFILLLCIRLFDFFANAKLVLGSTKG